MTARLANSSVSGSAGARADVKRLALRIDAAVLARVQRVSRRIQVATGYDCFVQRDWAYFGVIGCYVLQIVDFLREGWIVDYGLALMSVVLIAMRLWQMSLGNASDARRRPPHLNYYAFDRDMGYMRCLMLLSCLLLSCLGCLPAVFRATFLSQWYVLSLVPLAVGAYLDSCNPLPPAPGKIREWVRGLRASLRPAPEVA